MTLQSLKQISKKGLTYILYASVLTVSFLAAWLLPVSETFKGVAAIPGIGSLCLLLIQVWKDERAHERAIELQNKQQDFVLGTASHMAEVAYDKHVKFCEEYIDRIQSGFQELMRDGPTRTTMNIGSELVRIRFKHSAWLTKEIEAKLKPFESALIRIGTQEHLADNLPTGEQRTKAIEEVYRYFGLVIGHEKPTKDEENVAIETTIEMIREILGINVLTELRKQASDLALKRVGGIQG